MTISFEPTRKRGRHFFQIVGHMNRWILNNGMTASDTEADAIAQGHPIGRSVPHEEMIATIETDSDTRGAIGNAFSKWTTTAKPWQYGADAPWMAYEIRRK